MLSIVRRALSQVAPNSLDELLKYARDELSPVLRDVRESFNRLATGPYDLGTIVCGTGIPVDAPSASRAIYIRLDGGAGTTLFVWEGAAWVGK